MVSLVYEAIKSHCDCASDYASHHQLGWGQEGGFSCPTDRQAEHWVFSREQRSRSILHIVNQRWHEYQFEQFFLALVWVVYQQIMFESCASAALCSRLFLHIYESLTETHLRTSASSHIFKFFDDLEGLIQLYSARDDQQCFVQGRHFVRVVGSIFIY